MRRVNDGNYPDGPVATIEVGTLGYFTDRPIIDMIGLTSANPEYISGKHNDDFFARPPPLILLPAPPGTLMRALQSDERFEQFYGEPIFIASTPMPKLLYLRSDSSQDSDSK